MKAINKSKIFILSALFLLCFCHIVEAKQYIAYSLKQARKGLISGKVGPRLTHLGGITHPFAVIYDENNKDLILVGRVSDKEKQEVTLDDFVVAMRATLKYETSPLVSIDRTSDTPKTGKQKVRFEGGIENSKFGKDLLDADVVLKKMGLGKLRTDIWGVSSYFDMSAGRWKKTGKEDVVTSRFWFKPSKEECKVGYRNGVAVVDKLRITVKTEVMSTPKIQDEIGDKFAMMITSNFDDISTYYAPLKRLGFLFRLAGLAEGINKWQTDYGISLPHRRFWLETYEVQQIDTPDKYPLLKNKEVLDKNGHKREMTIDGGIELESLVLELQDKTISTLKPAVLKSRPDRNSLIWEVPLEAWGKPGIAENKKFKTHLQKLPIGRKMGMSLNTSFSEPGHHSVSASVRVGSTPLSTKGRDFNFVNRLSPQNISPNVGGVMLQGAAEISGAKEAKVNLSGGNFSLIVDGENARLAPDAFRKFITALWTVYYSNQDPGISIDPIAPGAKKHLVRYIGKVMNTDLGRVMRKADYLMKQWAVGTERPDIPGFENPDDISARRGIAYVGAMSRFWFVPEDMEFKRGGNMLLFEDGRMTVKTEFMYKGDGMKADPANEEFARYFSKHYHREISSKYPVYKELFEYAKMVSLAKYLKERDIPLYWFLMANKDLVITEDSPGTVDALAKGSDYFRGLSIEGGVNLRTKGNYIYDREAVNAINEAVSKLPASAHSQTRLSLNKKEAVTTGESFSFDLDKGSYTVIPQHSLTSGKDRRGIRYQTDVALKASGFRLTKETLDDFRSELFYKKFSKQLRKALPSVPPQDENNKEEYEILYKKIGKRVQRKVDNTLQKVKGLVDQEYKTGKELTKALEKAIGRKQTVKLKSLIIKHAYYETNLELVRFYNPRERDGGEFGRGWHILIPYRIKPAGSSKRKFHNARIPEKMAVENLLTGEQEILTFSTDRYSIAGYVPEELEPTQLIGLFIMSGGSYRLADKLGNEFWLNQAGYLTDMIFSEYHRFHFEYVDSFTDAFEHIPYEIEPASQERTNFLNVSIPKKMKVKDLIHGSSQVLTFSDEGRYAGYVPENAEMSRFKILALMSDASFRLVDKFGKEACFSPSGHFDKMAFSPEHPMVSSISQGRHKVEFKYTIDDSGKIMIAGASLLGGKKGAEPSYFVDYQYDDEGRLCKVVRSGSQVADLYDQPKSKVIAMQK